VKPLIVRRQHDPFEDAASPSFLTELLFPLPAQRRTTLGILTWWESRRLLFNIIVGATGLVTLSVIAVADLLSTHRLAIFDLSAWIPVLVYGTLANV
jgi:hypothetical protein